MSYNFSKIEKKWQKFWQKNKTYEPDLARAKKPFYNLMMFPYPSAEGLHVGNMYAFTGSDIYGRFKRMQGYDVFEPIGLDGFGIHSENYALKIGAHPMKQAKISEKRFYKQLATIGNGFAWNEKLETYNADYYKWTQWIFLQLFKNGLAYRKKSPVNWCSSCKTVLADEQVINEKCERCSNIVIKKELEQWFFKITDYAEKLLQDLKKIDWSEKVKIAQKNWIGKSEGAEIDFEVETKEKPNFVLLHGYNSSPRQNFFPWLKKELEKKGYKVQAPSLPHPEDPRVTEQVAYALKHVSFDKNTVILGHSFGGIVARKILEHIAHPVRRTILVGTFIENKFLNNDSFAPYAFDWKFDVKKIKENAGEVIILHDIKDKFIYPDQPKKLQQLFGGTIFETVAQKTHFFGLKEPEILRHCLNKITVFTTRPDTLFGATYLVLSSEHPLIVNCCPYGTSPAGRQLLITNYEEVKKYIQISKNKSDEEKIENKNKTGIELKGIKAINPANGEKIPVWISDYVLSGYGSGAIMAVPAHDQRDFEFAQKFKLPIKMVICPHYPAPTCPVLDKAYEGDGHLVDSLKFTGMKSEEAKWQITEFVNGRKKIQYRLRDWLISRQRYWGPPIPLVFCDNCHKKIMGISNFQFPISKQELKGFSKGELENPGWVAVPEKDLPVKLPFVKEFRPTGTEKSPLASIKSFYKIKCPKCKGIARRETDVSDTFLDSAWYYIGFLAKTENPKSEIRNPKQIQNSKFKIQNSPFSNFIARKWLPVNMYIGGAEHSVLHLLYTRFLAKAFHDWGLVDFNEPFTKFRAHGLLIKEGAKMSKSKGNVVNPDEYIHKFGADVLRMYLMFLAPFEQGGDFRDSGILGITRFLERVWKFNTIILRGSTSKILTSMRKEVEPRDIEIVQKLERLFHKTIKKITEDIENLQYNTAVSALMILFNEMEKVGQLSVVSCQLFLKLLAPFAPHITEELWSRIQNSKFHAYNGQAGKIQNSVHNEPWPVYDPKLIIENEFDLIIQINGKYKGTIKTEIGVSQTSAEKLAFSLPNVQEILKNAKIKKIIFVKNRLINFVV